MTKFAHTSTGTEAFSLFICLDAKIFVLRSFFSLMKTIYPRVSTKPLPNDAKVHFRLTSVAQKRCCLSSPNILRKLHNSSDHTKAKCINSFSLRKHPPHSSSLGTFRAGERLGDERSVYLKIISYNCHELSIMFALPFTFYIVNVFQVLCTLGGCEELSIGRSPFLP